MNRIFTFLYGAASYVVFLAAFLYAIGFVGNFGVPKSLDTPASGPWQTALWVDLGLLSLFAVQHSVMARPAFKRMLTKVVPAAIERSTYVLASSFALLFLFWQWQPLGGTVWEVQNGWEEGLLYGGYAFGWALVLLATFVINHFDLFGLRQVWRHLLGKPQAGLGVWHAVSVPHRSPSALCGLVVRLLEYASHDRDPLALRSSNDSLHSGRNSV